MLRNTSLRATAIRLYALKRANGRCEGCEKPAPFDGKFGPFLEVHHLHRLGDGGPDHPGNVIALCPNCHREVHFGKKGQKYNLALTERIMRLENEQFYYTQERPAFILGPVDEDPRAPEA
ncbi:HNH endonuclease signature motif containing protein [Gallaecimonas kandeliae]|uniref:HNH endonuclease n=1 Tax=Gallaecimonas kandeliae TaxID=3029055 RepID=UPI0026486581|nr:HNH endonuclease signature motif containing protein [Gallaecimonas kandeliae]WKE66436.1 HNH endonuclease signature motif containing protein [Gallaecimonas kandeliae]